MGARRLRVPRKHIRHLPVDQLRAETGAQSALRCILKMACSFQGWVVPGWLERRAADAVLEPASQSTMLVRRTRDGGSEQQLRIG